MPRHPRADRLDLLARTLRDRPGITAAELAAALGVTIRSVFRDLGQLREKGYPIEASRGRGGGLRLHRHWGLSRVLLSSEEALCALLSLAISERMRFPMFAREVAAARRRIVDAFPARERRLIAPLRERIFIGPPASARVRASYQEPAGPPIRRLQAAFVAARRITAEYVKEGGQRSVRVLEPHALVINWPAWYLLAIDRSKDERRTFRLDRFLAVDEKGEGFVPDPRGVARELLEHPDVALSAV